MRAAGEPEAGGAEPRQGAAGSPAPPALPGAGIPSPFLGPAGL